MVGVVSVVIAVVRAIESRFGRADDELRWGEGGCTTHKTNDPTIFSLRGMKAPYLIIRASDTTLAAV